MPRIISRPTVGGIQLLVMVFALLFLESCGSLGDSLLTSQATVKRSDTVRIAELYLNHRWTPSQANVYHGVDGEGIPVNTPDEFYGEVLILQRNLIKTLKQATSREMFSARIRGGYLEMP